MKADFYITYHHTDEMAARWIASELKQGKFSTLSDSWDFLPGEAGLEKINFMFRVSRFVMVLVSGQFLDSYFNEKDKINKSFGKSRNLFSKGFLVRIDSCEIKKVLGDVEFIDLADINEKEAVKRLLKVVWGAAPGEKEIEPLQGSVGTWDEILTKQKQERDQLFNSTIKHNYHMKLDLKQEVEREVEEEEETDEFEEEIEKIEKKEKRKEWVWESVPLETINRIRSARS